MARLGHLLPFLKLLVGKNGFQLRVGVGTNLLNFCHSIVARKRVVLEDIAHFLVSLIHNRLDLRFLVGGQIEDERHPLNAWSAKHGVMRRGIGGRCLRHVRGFLGARGGAGEEAADGQRREKYSFGHFHKLFVLLNLIRLPPFSI